ncbi:MAG: hypothetical protein D6806_16325 [Deltaproteobacteria bacterium]|nr:MAG: hypothetical protein D6806_16325 [Deltaproteobacteria bacterium]
MTTRSKSATSTSLLCPRRLKQTDRPLSSPALHLFLEIISMKAKGEGVSEYEIYRRYLADDPHSDAGSDEKLAKLLKGPEQENEVHEPSEEYLY